MSAHPLDRSRLTDLVSTIFADDLHAKRVASLAGAAVGVLEGAALGIHAIGRALASAEGLEKKHAVKQVDRLFSNRGVVPWQLFASWVPHVIGDRKEIIVALDWTEFDADDQSTLALMLITNHGRATPLLWKTVVKSKVAGWRNDHEDALLQRFREVVPPGVKVTILADRGFGDQKLYELLKDQLGFEFVVRFRGVVHVTNEHGETRKAKDWVPPNGRAFLIPAARVTKVERQVGAVVCTKARGMKEPWCLAASDRELTGAQVVKLYSRRFTIEESFRDHKNLRFGMGLSETRIGSPERRDRVLLVSAIAVVLLTMLGAAGEAIGIDKWLKTNTVKHRTISLLNQGLFHYAALPRMKPERAEALMAKFGEMLLEQQVFREVFGLV